MVLNKDELLEVKGGASTNKLGWGLIIISIGTFIAGVIDGFLRPLKCN